MCLISDYTGDYAWTEEFLSGVAKYFECYDHYYFHENSGLYVWQDDIMIGMDNDPATFGRPPFSTANIYLNSFMCVELEAGARLYRQFGKEEAAKRLLDKREALIGAIQQECWDKRDHFFYSVDVDIKTRKYDWFHQGLEFSGNTAHQDSCMVRIYSHVCRNCHEGAGGRHGETYF